MTTVDDGNTGATDRLARVKLSSVIEPGDLRVSELGAT